MQGRQSQQSGENSHQVQVQGDYHVHQGVTEQRATEIAQSAARAVLAEYDEEAQAIGVKRIEQFADRLIPKLEEKNLLEIFRDPSFHVLLRKAQTGAASSDREADYDMLASLLADRAERGDDRTVGASVDRAVQVVDLLDDRALNGLTVWQAFNQYTPVSGEIGVGLDALEKLFSQLTSGPLPEGANWIDHLDTLGVIRESDGLRTKLSSVEIWARMMPGYVSQGILSEEISEVLERQRLEAPALNIDLIDHELKPGWKRFPAPSIEGWEKTWRASGTIDEPALKLAVRCLREVFQVGTRDSSLDERFKEEIFLRSSLRFICEWLDQVPAWFAVTGVGRVLARANAERLDGLPMLPPLD